FTPDLSLVQDLPLAAKAHIVLAWVLILLVPFSRLIHMFAVPLEYIGRPWQNVVWVSDRRKEAAPQAFVEGEARRYFVKGGLAAVFGLSLLSVGVFDKIFRFFFGPRLTAHQETELMTTRLSRLEATSSQRKLELERQENDYILVGSLAELSSEKGKYFIDYSMMPALAFKTAEGLPLLISAKCTHLGCTVGADAVDGKILCPCHISYFSIDTGMPNADSPAKTPLPHLGWVVMDTRGNQLASFSGNGAVKGTISEAQRTSARVYIAKAHQIG
ncbi:MAG TPA: respiratory nitrate reductase subunit gamma, partial [Candidatus Obscuribacter sp.]|nr:respiratory nitrate reductase subunit gamma [Candidatus Obscuribacter sp.]